MRYSSFEVDSTESIWYTVFDEHAFVSVVLKLTPQSQYGIVAGQNRDGNHSF